MLRFGSLPVKAKLAMIDGWVVTSKHRNDTELLQFDWARSSESRFQIDIHPVREAFFRISSFAKAKEFFEEFGPYRTNASEPWVTGKAEEITFDRLVCLQDIYKDALLSDPKSWKEKISAEEEGGLHRLRALFESNFRRSPVFTLQMGHIKSDGKKHPAPFLEHWAKDVAGAIWASIYLDKMMGLRGSVCSREGCPNVFIRENEHGKRWCSDGCGVQVRVANLRKKKKLGAANAKA